MYHVGPLPVYCRSEKTLLPRYSEGPLCPPRDWVSPGFRLVPERFARPLNPLPGCPDFLFFPSFPFPGRLLLAVDRLSVLTAAPFGILFEEGGSGSGRRPTTEYLRLFRFLALHSMTDTAFPALAVRPGPFFLTRKLRLLIPVVVSRGPLPLPFPTIDLKDVLGVDRVQFSLFDLAAPLAVTLPS